LLTQVITLLLGTAAIAADDQLVPINIIAPSSI
jgi:hypothetical protein